MLMSSSAKKISMSVHKKCSGTNVLLCKNIQSRETGISSIIRATLGYPPSLNFSANISRLSSPSVCPHHVVMMKEHFSVSVDSWEIDLGLILNKVASSFQGQLRIQDWAMPATSLVQIGAAVWPFSEVLVANNYRTETFIYKYNL